MSESGRTYDPAGNPRRALPLRPRRSPSPRAFSVPVLPDVLVDREYGVTTTPGNERIGTLRRRSP